MTTTEVPRPDPSIVEDRARSVGEMFFARVDESPGREAFRYPDGDGWLSITWGEAGERVGALAAALVELGVEPEQRVAIASSTRWEWILSDLAINAAGAATTTVYPTTVQDDVAYILADSESVVVLAEDDTQVAKLRASRGDLPAVRRVIVFDGTPDDGDDPWVVSLPAALEAGRAYLVDHPDVVRERLELTAPDSLATLIYTSGTTGRPKGVRLSHDSWTYEGAAIASLGVLTADDLEYRWLPLAHSFGKVLLTAQLQIGYAAAVDGRVDKIVENLGVVKPTFMGAAPRIFEKAYGRIVATAQGEGGAKAKIFDWACGVGAEHLRHVLDGTSAPLPLRAQHALADRLVFSKVRARFGGRVRFFVSGSAALSDEVARWFHAAGITILEGYGLTETSAGTFLNRLGHVKIGTVGPPMPGTEVKIAEDGEILVRGPGVMQGYHGLEEETAAALVGDGWMATGDIGEVDADGFLRITDRKKDLFKTSNGKYVAPSHVEGLFKGISPLASQMVVHGHDRNFVSALITLDPDAVTDWAGRNGMEGQDYATVVASEAMQAEVKGHVDELNQRLNRWEQVKRFQVLDHDLSIEEGEITPSMKVKRRVVETRYADVLDGFYQG